MAAECPGTRPAGDPASALADAIVAAIGQTGTVALLSASGHMEDHQVVAFLAGMLTARGCTAVRVHPRQIDWDRGQARIIDSWNMPQRLDAIVRFYQGEWLAMGRAQLGWSAYFRGGRTPMCNPGTALAIESKRFPLTWPMIGLELRTWRALLPATIDPRDLSQHPGAGWVLKSSYCNTGDTVTFSDGCDASQWRRVASEARRNPRRWAAQRRFEAVAIPTPRGPMYPCLGVYTIDGRSAGLFGRLSSRPLIDFAAMEVAVLVRDEAAPVRAPL
jgi:hypothetical protein